MRSSDTRKPISQRLCWIITVAQRAQSDSPPLRLPVAQLPLPEQVLARELERLLGDLHTIQGWAEQAARLVETEEPPYA